MDIEHENQQPTVALKHIRKEFKTYRQEFDRFKEAMTLGLKSYHKNFAALQDVNLEVYKGECLGIIGTNGSGKSTLLKIITGVLQPTSGEMKVNGRISSLLELGAGFNRNYTGRQNIVLNGQILGLSKEEIEARIPEVEKFAGIGDFIDQPVRKYSSGMFARLAFAVAINVDPDILIVDEALSVGDIFFQIKCYHKFDEFRKAGKTILFVSHDLGSVTRYCDRCLLLHHGEQVAVGNCKEVVDMYRRIMVEQHMGTATKADASQADEAEAIQASLPQQTVWHTSLLANPDCQDYGSREAEIIDYAVMNAKGEVTSSIPKGGLFSVLVRFRMNQAVPTPIFAMTIRDQRGNELCGTNTMYEGKTLEYVEAGTTGVVRFTQRMTLQGGQYLLALGLTGFVDGNLVAYHRLYDICHLQVVSDKNTVGVFDPESTITYEELRLGGELEHA